jgi:hypothetical protein
MGLHVAKAKVRPGEQGSRWAGRTPLSFVRDAIATGSALAILAPIAAVATGMVVWVLRRVFRAPRWR